MANQKALTNLFTGLPLWAKGVLALLIVGIIIYIAIQAKNIIKSVSDKIAEKKSEAATKSELKDYAKQGIKPSYMDSQYKGWANKIGAAMDGFGTDEDAIYDVFRLMKNDADVLKLIEAYGTRTFPGMFMGETSFTLSSALQDELNRSELNKLNGILRNAGISYTF